MADVFISYAGADRKLVKALARHIESAGFSTWWDHELEPHQDFRDEIDKQLDCCCATVAIWTVHSISSRWVRSEADHALRLRRLINVRSPALAIQKIPKPFDQMQSVEANNPEAILKSVRALVANSGKQAQAVGSFANDAINAIKNNCNSVKFILDVKNIGIHEEYYGGEQEYAAKLRKGAEELRLDIEIFLDGLDLKSLNDFAFRRRLKRVKDVSEAVLPTINKELAWLERRPSSLVIDNAHTDLSGAVEKLLSSFDS